MKHMIPNGFISGLRFATNITSKNKNIEPVGILRKGDLKGKQIFKFINQYKQFVTITQQRITDVQTGQSGSA